MVQSIVLMIAGIIFTHLLLRVARGGGPGSDNMAMKAFVVLTMVVVVISALVLLAINSGNTTP